MIFFESGHMATIGRHFWRGGVHRLSTAIAGGDDGVAIITTDTMASFATAGAMDGFITRGRNPRPALILEALA